MVMEVTTNLDNHVQCIIQVQNETSERRKAEEENEESSRSCKHHNMTKKLQGERDSASLRADVLWGGSRASLTRSPAQKYAAKPYELVSRQAKWAHASKLIGTDGSLLSPTEMGEPWASVDE